MLESANRFSLNVTKASPKIALTAFGENLYDGIILFAPTESDLKAPQYRELEAYIQSSTGLIVATGEKVSSHLRKLLDMLGFSTSEDVEMVVDHVYRANKIIES